MCAINLRTIHPTPFELLRSHHLYGKWWAVGDGEQMISIWNYDNPQSFGYGDINKYNNTIFTADTPWEQLSWGLHGAHLGPTGPTWAPCWPHEFLLSGLSPEKTVCNTFTINRATSNELLVKPLGQLCPCKTQAVSVQTSGLFEIKNSFRLFIHSILNLFRIRHPLIKETISEPNACVAKALRNFSPLFKKCTFLYGPCMIVPHKWTKICWLATAN